MRQLLKAYGKQIFHQDRSQIFILALFIVLISNNCKVENTRTKCIDECSLNRNLCFVLGNNQSQNTFNIYSTCFIISSFCESNCIQKTTSTSSSRTTTIRSSSSSSKSSGSNSNSSSNSGGSSGSSSGSSSTD